MERSIELVSKAYALDTRSESDAKNESSEKNESDAKSVSERVEGRVEGRDCFAISCIFFPLNHPPNPFIPTSPFPLNHPPFINPAISILLSNLGFSRYAMN